MNYQVPQHISKDKIFIVNRSTIDNRLDAQYYSADLDLSGFVKLSSVAIVKGGKRIPKGYGYSNEQTPYHYLRVADMDSDAQVEVNNLMNISEEVFNILERYEILEGELAISIAGTIGKTIILKNIPIDKRVILTENCAKILAKTNVDLLPEYLKICLELPIVKKQLDLNYIQTTIPKLGLDKIVGIKIPPIPCIQKQQEIVDYINEAYIQKRAKEVESQQLLDSIDGYLLKELGITIPSVDDGLKNRIFLSSFSKIEGNRIDPIYSLYLDKNASSAKYDNTSLRSVAHIEKGNTLSSSDVEEGNIPVIAGGQTSPYNHNKSNYKGNIITVSASGAYAGYVWYHDYPIYATDCCVIFSKDESIFITKYLFEVLKLQQNGIYRSQTGAAQPHVYASDLQMLNIPVISIKKQKEIVDYIANIRTRAKALQAEGKAILEDAKRKVEEMIIG
ncbi:MAG: restriction endonuclease subunit S [Bacteroidales bacterium]|nr:restriction endonuclease subunit S [Bacteroidales bacterium]